MKCSKHPKQNAVGYCMGCGDFFCQSCLVSCEGGKLYCSDCVRRLGKRPAGDKRPAYETPQTGTKLVVSLKNGKRIKGTTLRIDPTEPGFYLTVVRAGREPTRRWVDFEEVKSVFRVKDLEGHYSQQDNVTEYAPQANEVRITYKDGETIAGSVLGHYDSSKPRFWVVPAEKDTNNISILVERSAVEQIEFGQQHRKLLFRTLADDAVKRRMLEFYREHVRTAVPLRQLAVAVQEDAGVVDEKAAFFIELGLFNRSVRPDGTLQYRFLPARDRALRDFISHTVPRRDR